MFVVKNTKKRNRETETRKDSQNRTKKNKFQHRQKISIKELSEKTEKEKIPHILFKWMIAGVQGTRLVMPGAMGIVHGDVVLSVGIPLAKWDERTARADVGQVVY